jgi:hypothetical protein
MISLLVLATGDPESWPGTYRRVLQGIEAVLGESPDSHPVTEAKLDSRLALRNLRAEIAIRRHQSPPQRLRHLAGAIVGAVNTFVGYQRGWTFSFFDPARYVRTLVANSDFRKFDDMLRMIRDCSREQRAAIVALLDGMRAEGKLAYGLHRSGHAVMTCLVYGMTDHIHFIDGADGGYAFAATQLKAQLARAAAPRHARYDRGACR